MQAISVDPKAAKRWADDVSDLFNKGLKTKTVEAEKYALLMTQILAVGLLWFESLERLKIEAVEGKQIADEFAEWAHALALDLWRKKHPEYAAATEKKPEVKN